MPVPRPTQAIRNLIIAMILILAASGCSSPSQGMADAAPDAAPPDAGTECPDWYSPTPSCTGEFTCEYGTESCCGVTHPSTVCECSNNEWSCVFTDACLLPMCDGFPLGDLTAMISEFEFTDPDALQVDGMGGLWVEASLPDQSATAPVWPVYGTGGLGSCSVYHYAIDALGVSTEPPPGDAGSITLSGPALGAPLDSPCTFDAGTGKYECVVDDKTGLPATATAGSATDTTHYTFAGIDFSAAPYYLQDATSNGVPVLQFSFAGFTDPSNNGRFAVTGIVAGSSDTVVALHASPSSADTTATASLRATAGLPTRAYSPDPGSPRDYLNGGSTNNDALAVLIGGSVVFPAIPLFQLRPAGQGLKLDSSKGQPHQFPTAAQAIEWSCATGDGVCGANPELFTVFRISGRTTTAPLTDAMGAPLAAWDMPAPAPNSTYATFRCVFIGTTRATLPAEAVSKILETNPTRIETRVSYESGFLVTSGSNTANVFVGHGLVGHTTP